jgi:hypothetical protein
MMAQPPYYGVYLPVLTMFPYTYCAGLATRGLVEIFRIPKMEREAVLERERRIRDGLPPDEQRPLLYLLKYFRDVFPQDGQGE